MLGLAKAVRIPANASAGLCAPQAYPGECLTDTKKPSRTHLQRATVTAEVRQVTASIAEMSAEVLIPYLGRTQLPTRTRDFER